MGRSVFACALALLGCTGSASTSATDGSVSADVAADAPIAADATDAPIATDVTDVTIATDLPAAQGFTTPVRQWTWVDIEGAVCGDGSPTGVAVNRAENPRGVLLLLQGGGACWDEQTCFVLNTAVAGPFGAAQFQQVTAGFTGTVLDRDRAQNPFAQWTLVLMPSCTGDMFLGDRDAAFGDAGRSWHFRGRGNLARALPRVAATAGTAPVAVLGLSFGGVGAIFNHALIREHTPRSALYLLSDSGVLLDASSAGMTLRERWSSTWGLGWLDARCAGCRADPTAIFGINAASFPADRTAMIGSRQDPVMRSYQNLSAGAYETALLAALRAFTATPTRRAFLVDGSTHGLTSAQRDVTAPDGTALLPWIGEMLSDSAAWTSHGL